LLLALLAGPVWAIPAKRVYAGVYLHDVTKLDQKDGVFDVDLELWAKWLGDFDAEKLALANGSSLTRELVGKENDGDWHAARWRVRGTLRGEFPLQRFPFDSQILSVALELPAQVAELIPDLAGSGVRSRFSITGWIYQPQFKPRVSTEVYRSDLGSLTNEGRPTGMNRVAFEVAIHRPLLMVGLKLFLPLVIILMVGMLGLFIHPDQLEARASIGVTALLSCFAFQFTVSTTLPDVAYLTIADGLFLVAYIVTSAALMLSIAAHFLHRRKRERAALRLDRISRVILPILACTPTLLFMRPQPSVAAAVAPPTLPVERPASVRDKVRIGVVNLPSILGAPTGSGLFWDVVHKEPDGSKHAAFVETVASVASDNLRFLGDGQLEVSWRIRKEARWSDGKPLTARDLQFASEVSKDPELLEARVLSPRDAVLRYSDRIAEALEGPPAYPAHALEAEFEKGGYAAVREARQKKVLPTVGPYRVVSFTAEDKLVLEPNPHFLGKPPSIPRVEIIRFKDSPSAVAAFEKGEIDILTPNTGSPEDVRALRQRRPDAVTLRQGSTFLFLAHDHKTPWLQKREVRRALLMAIDRERLRREVYGQEGRVADVPIPGLVLPNVKAQPHDPVLARASLEKHGLAGTEVTLTYGGSAVDKKIAELVAADLTAAGLKPSLKTVARTSDVYRDRAWSGLLLHGLRGSRDSGVRAYWNLPIKDGRYVATFRHDAFDDEIAALVDRERRALYPERREQLRDLSYAAYAERLPTLPLLFASERMVVDPLLRGWDNGPAARFAQGIERWHFVAR
jgi:peptide/nickel transport system substrate-binding protein